MVNALLWFEWMQEIPSQICTSLKTDVSEIETSLNSLNQRCLYTYFNIKNIFQFAHKVYLSYFLNNNKFWEELIAYIKITTVFFFQENRNFVFGGPVSVPYIWSWNNNIY
jgi:predicted Zn-dependent protease